MKQHVASVRTNIVIYRALAAAPAGDGGGCVHPDGAAEFSAGDGDCHDEGGAHRVFFMHALHSHRLTLVIAVASLLWLAIMISLTLSDYHSRGWLDIPGK